MKQVLFCLLTIMLSCTVILAQPRDNNQAEIKFEKTNHDFGTVNEGTQVPIEFKFVNIGKEPLILNSVNGSAGGVTPNYPKNTINPGKIGIIKVNINTLGRNGLLKRSVTVQSNAKSGMVVLTITGTVTPNKSEPMKK
ncbi:MAG: DUF1573 domain-containing protein [Chitinophagaceae bacterium]